MSLLSICKEAARAMGLEEIGSVSGSSNRTARRLWASANRAGRSIARRAYWQFLISEQLFLTVPTEVQYMSVPTDFDRLVPETAFNRTMMRKLIGPLTPAEWQEVKSHGVSAGIGDKFRIRGDHLLITPAPAAGQTIAYEYRSKWWVDTGPAPDGILDADQFTTDSDEPGFDDEMMILDTIWRYEKSVGLPYAEDFRSAELVIADRMTANAAGKQIMDLMVRRTIPKVRVPTIPDGNWTL